MPSNRILDEKVVEKTDFEPQNVGCTAFLKIEKSSFMSIKKSRESGLSV